MNNDTEHHNSASLVAAVLRRAAERVERPGAWIKGAFAADAGGALVAASDPEAVCWCTAGAIGAEAHAADPVHPGPIYVRAKAAVTARLLHDDATIAIGEWNDAPERTLSDVVALLRSVADEQEASGHE